MQRLRNNRRILGAILLTTLCFVASTAPAAAFDDRGAVFDERTESRFDRLVERFEAGVSSLLQSLKTFWSASGARIED
ncbi:MAG: hypothetical protein ACE5GX_15555 [Thermoanaerobaculia bacterium]